MQAAAGKWWTELPAWKKVGYPALSCVIVVGVAVGLYFPIRSIENRDEVERTWTARECEVTAQTCTLEKCSSAGKSCACRVQTYQEYGYSLADNCRWLADEAPAELGFWETPGAASPECIGDYKVTYSFRSPTEPGRVEMMDVTCGKGQENSESSLCPFKLGKLCVNGSGFDADCTPEQLSVAGQTIPCWTDPETGAITIEGVRDVTGPVAAVIVVSFCCAFGVLIGGAFFVCELRQRQKRTEASESI